MGSRRYTPPKDWLRVGTSAAGFPQYTPNAQLSRSLGSAGCVMRKSPLRQVVVKKVIFKFRGKWVHAGIPPQEIDLALALQLLDSCSIHPMLSCLEVLEPPGVLCDCMTVHKVTGISRIREGLGFGH